MTPKCRCLLLAIAINSFRFSTREVVAYVTGVDRGGKEEGGGQLQTETRVGSLLHLKNFTAKKQGDEEKDLFLKCESLTLITRGDMHVGKVCKEELFIIV